MDHIYAHHHLVSLRVVQCAPLETPISMDNVRISITCSNFLCLGSPNYPNKQFDIKLFSRGFSSCSLRQYTRRLQSFLRTPDTAANFRLCHFCSTTRHCLPE